MGAAVNASISKAPISYVEAGGPTRWYMGHIKDKLPAPMLLTNGAYLRIYHLLGVRRKAKFLTTLEYSYTYQATPDDDDEWIFRYEYIRKADGAYDYPRAHVHVNGRPGAYKAAKAFPTLHLPTGGRVTIEDMIRHLIGEHGLKPVSPDWEKPVREAEEHFQDIQWLRRRTPRTTEDDESE
jgi:hypothetical protein